MGWKIRAISITAAAVLTVAAAVTITQAVTSDPESDIEWKQCEDAEDDVQCATLEVPLDYDAPDGDKIEIGLAKRAATDPDARIGNLLTSGIDMVTDPSFESQQMREKFDLIGFDPRGIGTSTNIECDPADLEAVHQIGTPTDHGSFQERAKANKEFAAGCRELTGELFDHSDNLHIVEDIESVREALGDDGLNLLLYSQGTLAGQQYAEKYPENIRTMVLDGNMDHSLEDAWEHASTETAAGERNFNSFAEWCDTTEDCALYGEDTAKVYGELRDAARAGELTEPDSGDLIDFTAFGQRTFPVNEPQMWPDLASDLKTLHDGQGTLQLEDESGDEPVAYIMQSICTNWDLSVKDFDEWEDISTRLAEEYPNTQWSTFVDVLANCIGDPVKTTNPPAQLEIEDAPPLVMIGTLNDYATVYEWSETAAEQSGATLITYEGYGHNIYGDNECIDEPVEAYLIDKTVPDEAISCESQDQPGS